MRILTFGLFLTVMLTVVGLGHRYLWLRLLRDAWPSPQVHKVGAVILVIMAFLLLSGQFIGRILGPDLARGLAMVTYIWMGLAFLLLVAVASIDLFRFIAERLSAEPWEPARRQFLWRSAGTGATTLVAGAAAWGVRKVMLGPVVETVDIGLKSLPKSLDGTTLVQLSDIHVGPTVTRPMVEQMVSIANSLKPDLVAITGDLVDGSVEALAPHVEPLKNLQARFGKFFITGNHEYYSGAESWVEHVSSLGYRVLRNERVALELPGGVLHMAGTDDHSAARFGAGHGEDMAAALGDAPLDEPVILLAHQPRSIDEAAKYPVDLMLSGHTHGGQMWPFGYLVKLVQPYVEGLHQHKNMQIYVNRGTGYWGPPMRIGKPCEITLIRLRSV